MDALIFAGGMVLGFVISRVLMALFDTVDSYVDDDWSD